MVGNRKDGLEGVGNEVIAWDPGDFRKIQEHPCYSKKAAHRYGRMHLAVAPDCNVQCNYCIRKFDCVNESRPGVASKVLTPQEALDKVIEVRRRTDFIKVVGVAGPGDPLANEATFETFRLIKEAYSDLFFCVSTNGLALPERLPLLKELGITHLTLTLNAVDPSIGKEIYSFVIDSQGRKLRGEEAARVLLNNQLRGIEEAVKADMLIKINSVLIPGINDRHLVDVAREIKKRGVFVMNIMSLIPQHKFADIPPPTPEMKNKVRDACSPLVHQMTHCRQCKADAIGRLGKDVEITPCASSTGSHSRDSVERVRPVLKDPFKVAVVSSAGKRVDLPFGAGREFYIFEVSLENRRSEYVEKRNLEEPSSWVAHEGRDAAEHRRHLDAVIGKIIDCDLMLCKRIGSSAREGVKREGIQVVEDYDTIENAIAKIIERMGGQQ